MMENFSSNVKLSFTIFLNFIIMKKNCLLSFSRFLVYSQSNPAKPHYEIKKILYTKLKE